jgi:hypothetical protein
MNKRKEGETSSPRCEASGILLGGGEAEGKEIVVGGDPAEFRLGWRCTRGEGEEEVRVGGKIGAAFIGLRGQEEGPR